MCMLRDRTAAKSMTTMVLAALYVAQLYRAVTTVCAISHISAAGHLQGCLVRVTWQFTRTVRNDIAQCADETFLIGHYSNEGPSDQHVTANFTLDECSSRPFLPTIFPIQSLVSRSVGTFTALKIMSGPSPRQMQYSVTLLVPIQPRFRTPGVRHTAS